MGTEFTREARYVVLKSADVMQCLAVSELIELRRIQAKVEEHRAEIGKPPLDCVVVESDWPEYEPTWNAIEARMTGAQPAPSVPEGWKLVPIEPTPGMIDAAEYVDWGDADVRGSCINALDRMLAAAPEARP